MNKTSVVTGATGYVGYALVRELLSRGERPRLLLLPGQHAPHMDNLPCDIFYGDITEPGSFEHAFEGAETVYHLAGLVDIGSGREDLVWRVNVDGTQHVVAACKASGVRRMVYCSSVDAVPPLSHGMVMSEPGYYSTAGLTGAYAKTKAVATQSVLNSASEAFDTVVCMPSAVIGPYDYNASAIGMVVRLFMRFPSPISLKDGGYNFVDVRDVAYGLAACADAEKAPSGASYLLTGEYLDVETFIAVLAELAGHKPPLISVPVEMAATAAPAAELLCKVSGKPPLFTGYSLRKITENGLFSHEKAARDLGYRPRGARESLADMIAWIRKNEEDLI